MSRVQIAVFVMAILTVTGLIAGATLKQWAGMSMLSVTPMAMHWAFGRLGAL